MKIREELSPAKRRLVGLTTSGVAIALWIIITLPVLPAPPETPPPSVPPTATEQAQPAADQSQPASEEGQPPAARPDIGINRSEAGGAAASGMTASSRRALVPAQILPSPIAVLQAIAYLHTDEALVRSAATSFFRVTTGFLLAALIAIPLGIFMGSYPPVRAAVEPLSNPLRYLPISAVTGIFMLLFGIGDTMKIMFLFAGSVVYLLPIVVESVASVDQVYLDTAYTLGAKPRHVIWRVLVPGACPGIVEACRVIYGIGWTYVILAELINAKYGLGYLITIAYRRGHIDWAYALVLVVLLLGIGTNEIFRQAQKWLFAWREA
jgi:NitT/TauT family transport system permease protein